MGRPAARLRSAHPVRRPAVVAFACALVAASSANRFPANADDVSPEVLALRTPLALRTTLERTSEHGCSQSFASSSSEARLALAVDAAGAVTLVVDVAAHETFGPSPHRWADGDHEVTHTTELEHAVFTGATTRPSAESIVIRFTRVERARVRFTGYGSLPLPPATTTAIDVTLRCALARTDVLPVAPAGPGGDEHPSPLMLLGCAFETNPEPFAALEAEVLPFGRGAGVVARVEHRMWGHETTRSVRRAP